MDRFADASRKHCASFQLPIRTDLEGLENLPGLIGG
jgi:hypothetical protein